MPFVPREADEADFDETTQREFCHYPVLDGFDRLGYNCDDVLLAETRCDRLAAGRMAWRKQNSPFG
jgi:hypothetical protein